VALEEGIVQANASALRQAANDMNGLINEIQLFVDHVAHLLTVKLLDASV